MILSTEKYQLSHGSVFCRLVKQQSEEVLKSIQKPFKFTLREQEEREQRQHDREKHLCDYLSSKKTFKAKPVPSHVFDDNIDEKIAEV